MPAVLPAGPMGGSRPLTAVPAARFTGPFEGRRAARRGQQKKDPLQGGERVKEGIGPPRRPQKAVRRRLGLI